MAAQPPNDPRQASPRSADRYSAPVAAELQRVFIAQGADFPFLPLLIVGVLAWSLRNVVAPTNLMPWTTVAGALLLLRWGTCVNFSRGTLPVETVGRRLRLVVLLLCAIGAWASSPSLLWFPKIPSTERLVITIAFFGWYASSMVLSVASPVSAFLFGLSLLGPVALAWIIAGGPASLTLALLSIAMIFFVRRASDNAHLAMREAIAAKLREEDLVRRLEQHSRELQSAMAAKTQFLAAASHDLRQPVTSMNLLLSALNASRDEKSLRAVAAKLEAPLKALEEILSSLLEMSRLEAGTIEVQRRVCSAHEIVEPLVAEYMPRASAKRLRLDAAIGHLRLSTDPELVRRIVRNLLDNAIKFTDAGSVRIDVQSDASTLVLGVTDTGRGVPESQQQRIFDDYFQADNPHRDRRAGLGLGLAIVRRLVGLLGGHVHLFSQPGRGSAFEVRIPNAVEPADAIGPRPHDAGVVRRARFAVSNVLVVEDDQLVVDAIGTLFRALGIDARYAADADDALIQTSLGRFVPDLALVDFGLPGTRDGISLIRELRTRLPNCAFLLITGDTRPEVIRRAAEAGIATLHKPLSVERLNEKLESLGIGA